MKIDRLYRVPAQRATVNGEYLGLMPAHYAHVTDSCELPYMKGATDVTHDNNAWNEYEMELNEGIY